MPWASSSTADSSLQRVKHSAKLHLPPTLEFLGLQTAACGRLTGRQEPMMAYKEQHREQSEPREP